MGFTSIIYCQTYTQHDIENKFINEWTLKSVEVNNKPTPLNSKQKNAHAVFAKDSTYTNISDNGQESGRWYFDYKKQVLIFNDGRSDSQDIKIKIERLTEKECILFFSGKMKETNRVFLEREK
jgi:hypothetical protein